MTGDKSSDVRDPETLHCPQHSSCLQLGSGRWCQEGVNLSLSEQNNSFLWSLLKQNDINLSDGEEIKIPFLWALIFSFSLYLLIGKTKLDNIKWEMKKWKNERSLHSVSSQWVDFLVSCTADWSMFSMVFLRSSYHIKCFMIS